jgi:hypothetical protein
MYNAKYFLVANLLNPYAVSSRNKLKTKDESSANHYQPPRSRRAKLSIHLIP